MIFIEFFFDLISFLIISCHQDDRETKKNNMIDYNHMPYYIKISTAIKVIGMMYDFNMLINQIKSISIQILNIKIFEFTHQVASND